MPSPPLRLQVQSWPAPRIEDFDLVPDFAAVQTLTTAITADIERRSSMSDSNLWASPMHYWTSRPAGFPNLASARNQALRAEWNLSGMRGATIGLALNQKPGPPYCQAASTSPDGPPFNRLAHGNMEIWARNFDRFFTLALA